MASLRLVILAALCLTSIIPSSLGCPFLARLSGREAAYPTGPGGLVAPSRERRLAYAGANGYVPPGLPIRDTAGTAMPIERLSLGANYEYEIIDGFLGLAKYAKREMCYFTMQVLPSPPRGLNTTDFTCPPDGCSWHQEDLVIDDLLSMMHYSELANDRWQQLIKPGGPVVWGGCTFGKTTRIALCENSLDNPALCNSLLLEKSPFNFATSSIVLRINNETAEQVKRTIRTWRSSPTGHRPHMVSDLVNQKGWFYTGEADVFMAKLIPCDLIPRKFWYTKSGKCDEMRSDGRIWIQDAHDFWTSACNAFYDETYWPQGGPWTCPNATLPLRPPTRKPPPPTRKPPTLRKPPAKH